MIFPREAPKNYGGESLLLHLYFDTMADFAALPTLTEAAAGSDAYCIATQAVYILSGAGVWEVQ